MNAALCMNKVTYETHRVDICVFDTSLSNINCNLTVKYDTCAYCTNLAILSSVVRSLSAVIALCVYTSASPHCTCIQLLLPTIFITHNINVEQGSG